MSFQNQTINLFNYNFPYIKLNNKDIRVGTFFSGVGSPEMALSRLKEDGIIKSYKIEFFCEVDKYAIKSYCAIHNEKPSNNLGDIKNIKGKNLKTCDIWIGGFPCQDISSAGKQKGFSKNSLTRSSLGWEMIRLLEEVKEKPKIIIFENVKAITYKKMEKTLNLFKNDLRKLGYSIYDDVLCALDYDIPQNRKRYFLVAVYGNFLYSFPKKRKLKLQLQDLLEQKVDPHLILSEKVHFNLCDFNSNNNINKIVIKNKKYINKKYIVDINRFLKGNTFCGRDLSNEFNQTSRLWSMNGYCPTLTAQNTEEICKIVIYEHNCFFVRKISCLESWRLMGFKDEDFYKAKNSGISNRQLYHQAGNSIVTNVFYYILKNLF